MDENFVCVGMGKTKRGDEQAICKCNVKRLGHDFALLQVLKKILETEGKNYYCWLIFLTIFMMLVRGIQILLQTISFASAFWEP